MSDSTRATYKGAYIMNQRAGRALFLHSLNLNRNVDSKANKLRQRYDTNMRDAPEQTQTPQTNQTETLQAQNAQLRAEIKRLKAEKK
jgi:hypothetical protein